MFSQALLPLLYLLAVCGVTLCTSNFSDNHRQLFQNIQDEEKIRKLYTFDFGNFAEKKGKVYYSIFAGRKTFMKIHFLYTDMLLAQNLIDEVHVWDFCVDNQEDREFLVSFINAPHQNPKYILKKNPPHLKNKYVDSRDKNYLWEHYYDFYSTSPEFRDEDILVKADDDIVFQDVSKFGDYIANIKTPNIYFPNIVNNDAGLYIQANRLAHPNAVSVFQEYVKLGVNFDHRFEHYFHPDVAKMFNTRYREICPLSSYQCNPPATDEWAGGIFMRGDLAHKLHEGFLENPTKFLAAHFGNFPRMVKLKQRISVNMFAGRFEVIKKMFSTFLDYQCCDDEGYIGKWPSLTHLDHMIDTHFLIVHYGFNMQYDTDGSNDFRKFIEPYHALALKMVAEMKPPSTKNRNSTSSSSTTHHHHQSSMHGNHLRKHHFEEQTNEVQS